MEKKLILAVDDDPDILEIIKVILEEEFSVITASEGNQVFKIVKEKKPDLLILDYVLPDISGLEICKKLREDTMYLHLPILMLTGKGETEDKVKGLETGVDDYMIKPFAPEELIARVKMLIRRSSIHLDANPLTRLPGNVSIIKELEEMIRTNTKFALLYIDLDNFKSLNDYYGFLRGDALIKEVAHLIIEAVQKKGSPQDFIGHIGGDDFILITSPENAENIAKEIIDNFFSIRLKFYDEKDIKKGFIETYDREGNLKKFDIVTISVGIINNVKNKYRHAAEITSKASEAKTMAKKNTDKKYIILD